MPALATQTAGKGNNYLQVHLTFSLVLLTQIQQIQPPGSAGITSISSQHILGGIPELL